MPTILIKRLWACLLVFILPAALFAGCSSKEDLVVNYDIASPVENLDPQFATDATAQMIIGNIFEGLVVYEPASGIVPGAASSYTVSDDGLLYTFHLRQGAAWSDGTPLTSADFLFSFQRLFSSQSPSPHAADYACIQNGAAILAGTMDVSALGVSAPDDETVVFALDYPSPLFLDLLAATPAAPCNQEAFRESRGRYGLEKDFVFSNGPFKLERWNNQSSIQLRKNPAYVSDHGVMPAGVNLYIGRSNSTKQFLDGNADLLALPAGQIGDIQAKYPDLTIYDRTTWAIVFNQSDPVLGNPLLRQSLAHTVDTRALSGSSELLSAPRGVVPPDAAVGSALYRELAGAVAPISYDLQRGAYLYGLALDALELEQLPSITFVVPDSGLHYQLMGEVQQGWQKNLEAYIHLETGDTAAIVNLLRSGRYQMLLVPLQNESGTAGAYLQTFTSASTGNHTGYRNTRYDTFVASAKKAGTLTEAANAYAMAETFLLADAVVIPVYTEPTAYAVSQQVDGIQIAPHSGYIYFKYARSTS